MPKANRRTDRPRFSLADVHAAAATREIVITLRARTEGARALPADLIDLDDEIRAIIVSLVVDEFQFAEVRTRNVDGRRSRSWVDVYRVDFEGCDLWLKIKLETDPAGQFVVVISLHEWDESIPL